MVSRPSISDVRRLPRTNRFHGTPGKRSGVQILHEKKINGKSSTEDDMIGVDYTMKKYYSQDTS